MAVLVKGIKRILEVSFDIFCYLLNGQYQSQKTIWDGIFVPAFLHSHWLNFSRVHSWSAFGTIFRTTGGFRNNVYSHRQLAESRNKNPEEGNWKYFLQVVSVS
jgi:hypothetical protein